jgi:lysophospholipase L1-like esterase
VINTRNTLVRANPTEGGNSNDWINEIHPNLGGYRKIAARLSAAVNEVLLG